MRFYGTHITLPVWKTGREELLRITEKGRKSVFHIHTGETQPDFFYPFPTLDGTCDIEAGDRFLSLTKGEEPSPSPPFFAFHYAPQTGWINDPNGLICKNGIYHLYHQYNPMGPEWGNMSWGHATSRDLLTWREEDAVLFPPDESHVIFSGSAIEEEGEIVYPYSLASLEKAGQFVQRYATSTDGYRLSDKGTLFTGPMRDSRDPRIFAYREATYLLLWITGTTFALFKRKGNDWHAWEETCRFDASPLWECPEILFPGEEILFTAADGIWRKAEIKDDRMFLSNEQGNLFLTKLPYAAQRFNGTDQMILIPWLRTKNRNHNFSGAMALPRVISSEKGRITERPPRGFFDHFLPKETITGTMQIENDAFTLEFSADTNMQGSILGTSFFWESNTETLHIGDEKISFPHAEGGIRIIVDKFLAEIQDFGYHEVAHVELHESGERNVSVSRKAGLARWRI
jgi:fructan beta-fructosidase